MRKTYYDEILECIELEDLSKHIDAQWDEVSKMESGYKKYSISTWLKWFGYYVGFWRGVRTKTWTLCH